MREIRTSGLMSGDWKRNYGANYDTGMGESRRQTVQPRSLRPPRQSSTLQLMPSCASNRPTDARLNFFRHRFQINSAIISRVHKANRSAQGHGPAH